MVSPVKTAYVFPGQGSQYVGMGRDLYDSYPSAKDIFKMADDALGISLTRLCFEGPEEDLRQTINAQPAILTVSLACMKAAVEADSKALPPPSFMAGHSLGEYTALAVAGVLDFPTAIYLARERGRLMHEAGQKIAGSMAAVLGMAEPVLAEICRETGVQIANFNSPGQLVISGTVDDIAKATALAKEKGALRIVPLQVSGAFHSRLMQAAVDGMKVALTKIRFKQPAVPVIANTSAAPVIEVEEIKNELIEQLTSGIQWQRSVEYMIRNGVGSFVEIGPGKVLSGLIKRIAREIPVSNIGDVSGVKQWSGAS